MWDVYIVDIETGETELETQLPKIDAMYFVRIWPVNKTNCVAFAWPHDKPMPILSLVV